MPETISNSTDDNVEAPQTDNRMALYRRMLQVGARRLVLFIWNSGQSFKYTMEIQGLELKESFLGRDPNDSQKFKEYNILAVNRLPDLIDRVGSGRYENGAYIINY